MTLNFRLYGVTLYLNLLQFKPGANAASASQQAPVIAMKDKIRILLADGHGTVRKQLRTRLSHEPEFEIVCEADNSADLIECAPLNNPDILLVDPIMRDGFGLQAVQRLALQLPGTAIVVLTAFTDTATDMVLRKMGVRHILTKDLDVQRLIDLLKSLKKVPDGDGTAAAGLPEG